MKKIKKVSKHSKGGSGARETFQNFENSVLGHMGALLRPSASSLVERNVRRL